MIITSAQIVPFHKDSYVFQSSIPLSCDAWMCVYMYVCDQSWKNLETADSFLFILWLYVFICEKVGAINLNDCFF